MNSIKLLLFTFDYELFLGERSGSVDECLINPTRRILNILNNNKYKGVFFIDTTYLLRLKKISNSYPNAAVDWIKIQNQIKLISADGHYIFPHIHPHWIDAEYIVSSNEWQLSNYRYYRFNAISEQSRMDLFEESIKVLEEILDNEYHNCKIDAYRAGGWSIQPFKDFKPCFERFGILHEWSVIPGKLQRSSAHYFDFRAVRKIGPYKFETDPSEEYAYGKYTEWPISIIKLSKFEKWLNFKINGLIQRFWTPKRAHGSTVNLIVFEEESIEYESGKSSQVASFEGLNPYLILKQINKIRKENYFHFISHPKMLTGIDFIMLKMLMKILSHFNIESDFRKWKVY